MNASIKDFVKLVRVLVDSAVTFKQRNPYRYPVFQSGALCKRYAVSNNPRKPVSAFDATLSVSFARHQNEKRPFHALVLLKSPRSLVTWRLPRF